MPIARVLLRRMALACVLAMGASACSDAPALTDLADMPDAMAARGGVKGPPDKGGGGGGGDDGGSNGSGTVAEDFGGTTLDPNLWTASTHPLGRGTFDPDNVSLRGGSLYLTTPAGTYDGAEIQSKQMFPPGAFEARLKASPAVGSLTAFFLYSFHDEIDIEIIPTPNGGEVYFVTYERVWDPDLGRYTFDKTHLAVRSLNFDPSADFHTYRIETKKNKVRFFIDDQLRAQFTRNIPASEMHLLASTWWPTWLDGLRPTSDVSAVIDWINY